jgi:hypothetical protein
MRKFFMTAFALSAMLVLASASFALERTSIKVSDDDSRADAWNASTSCSIIYYNFCTGWLWGFTGFAGGDRFGVCFESCCPTGNQATLATTWHDFRSPVPAGYGFTGVIDVSAGDANCCPSGAPIASQPWLPAANGWNAFNWGVPVPPRFVVTVTIAAAGSGPIVVITDHPAAGTTGPVACGTCYPLTRVNHSYGYLACPGSIFFNDGVCDAQLVWDAALVCDTISVEQETWGGIKNLYR